MLQPASDVSEGGRLSPALWEKLASLELLDLELLLVSFGGQTLAKLRKMDKKDHAFLVHKARCLWDLLDRFGCGIEEQVMNLLNQIAVCSSSDSAAKGDSSSASICPLPRPAGLCRPIRHDWVQLPGTGLSQSPLAMELTVALDEAKVIVDKERYNTVVDDLWQSMQLATESNVKAIAAFQALNIKNSTNTHQKQLEKSLKKAIRDIIVWRSCSCALSNDVVIVGEIFANSIHDELIRSQLKNALIRFNKDMRENNKPATPADETIMTTDSEPVFKRPLDPVSIDDLLPKFTAELKYQ